MQAEYVLPKVVRPWPNLALLGAVGCSAHVRFASVDFVNALLVSIQVVLGGETRLPRAALYFALVIFLMAKSVFAMLNQSLTATAKVGVEHTYIQTCS